MAGAQRFPLSEPQAAIITNAASRKGRQSVEVWGGDLVGSGGITAPYDAVGSYRIPLNYTASSKKPVIILEADLKLETDQPCTIDDFFTVTIAARSGNNETLGEIGVSSSGFAEAYGFNAAPGAAPAFLSPIRLNRWHKISIAIDYSGANPVVYYYVDGRLIGTTLTTSTSPFCCEEPSLSMHALMGSMLEDPITSRDSITSESLQANVCRRPVQAVSSGRCSSFFHAMHGRTLRSTPNLNEAT